MNSTGGLQGSERGDGAARGRPGYSRDEVVAVATEQFLAHGYEATSMGDLARELGISKSAIYHHVSSKEQLLQEAITVALDALSGVVTEVQELEVSIEQRLQYLISGAVEVLGQRQAEIALLLRLRGNSDVEQRALGRRREITNAVVELIAEAQAAGVLRGDILPGIAGRLIFGVVNSMVDWYRPEGEASLSDVTEMLQAFIWTGLARPS